MSYMFKDCYSLRSLPDISKWDTKNVTNMSNMLQGWIFLDGILKMLLIWKVCFFFVLNYPLYQTFQSGSLKRIPRHH